MLGDEEGQKDLRERTPYKTHCRWLRKDSNACMCLPEGLDGAEEHAGQVCPNNAYENHPDVFSTRDMYGPDLERIFRLVSESELGVLRESDLDPVALTELITAKSEIDKRNQEQEAERRDRMEAERRLQQAKSGTGARR